MRSRRCISRTWWICDLRDADVWVGTMTGDNVKRAAPSGRPQGPREGVASGCWPPLVTLFYCIVRVAVRHRGGETHPPSDRKPSVAVRSLFDEQPRIFGVARQA